MSEAGYAVVFRGEILDGYSREQVKEGFGRMFGLGADKLELLFSQPRVVLKKGLSRDVADRYRLRLESIGAQVRLEAAAAPQRLPSAPTPVPPIAAAPTQPAATGAARLAVPQAREPLDSGASAKSVRPAPVARHAPGAAAVPAAPAAADGVALPGQAMVTARPRPEAAPAGATVRPAAARQAEPRSVPFEFHGNGFEFFRIWIVNLLLTIVTLGVYSAWAKVRTQRYFYGNTVLDGSSFDYLGDPLKILKGRIIAFVCLMLYSGADLVSPFLSLGLMLAFLVALPWIMVKGLSFRNLNSAWRGVRFGFEGKVGEAAMVFLLWPLLGVLTLGLLMPMAFHRQQCFIIGNSRYGTCRFEFGAGVKVFYGMFLGALAILIGGGIAGMLLGSLFAPLSVPAMALAYLAAFAWFSVKFANLRYGHTLLAGNGFEARYALGSYARLMAVNLLGMVLTLGLFYPWAKVRNARYAAEHVALVAEDDLDGFVAARQKDVSATAGEVGDLFDVDFGI
ncbi:YjgN family protein [Azotobacter salinestris]|uniref:YjgN family protein n=1 Tax=Azotobacter salinestris TaxID=69964 RepID=UPI001266DBFB|nr:YjgN family protein [Azotobacter salinestris]